MHFQELLYVWSYATITANALCYFIALLRLDYQKEREERERVAEEKDNGKPIMVERGSSRRRKGGDVFVYVCMHACMYIYTYT